MAIRGGYAASRLRAIDTAAHRMAMMRELWFRR
jgi:hypothetical protein